MRRFADTRGGVKPIAEINVTSLVDVTMILLIIFILVAPILEQGLDVRLPAAEPAPMSGPASVTLYLDAEGNMALEDTPVRIEDLRARLGDIAMANPDVYLVVRADESLDYGKVVRALDAARSAGIVRLGMATRPTRS
jgi:biopolymer transport protein ExbD